MNFQSVDPSAVKSIKQRDLLNNWLRLYVRLRRVPLAGEYRPDRFAEEEPDLVHYRVEGAPPAPRFVIERIGSRVLKAYGGEGGDDRYLDEYLGPRLGPSIMPVYFECVRRALPIYTIATLTDLSGRVVAHERLLLPFSQETGQIASVIASQKTISEDGGFEIRRLLRANDGLPAPVFFAVIDRKLFHDVPRHSPKDDVTEIDSSDAR